MGVRADDEEVFDAGFCFHAFADGGHALARGRPADVETDERDGLVAGLEDEGLGIKRIHDADAGRIVPGTVSPHGEADGRSDIDFRDAGLETGLTIICSCGNGRTGQDGQAEPQAQTVRESIGHGRD